MNFSGSATGHGAQAGRAARGHAGSAICAVQAKRRGREERDAVYAGPRGIVEFQTGVEARMNWQLRQKVTFAIFAEEEDLDKVSALVDSIFSVPE
jgi:hypothetical protein